MDQLSEVTLGDIGKAVARYRPFIAVMTGILLIAVFLPGEPRSADDGFGDLSSGRGPESTGLATQSPGSRSPSATTGPGDAIGGADPRTAATPPSGMSAPSEGVTGDPAELEAAGDGSLNATCDESTGRLALPSLAAPPCVQVGSNTGDDHQGVTADAIKVVYYQAQEDPTSEAILAAAGASDTDEEAQQTVRDWVDYYTHHYETYGREIEVVFVKGSGPADDDEAAIADARRIAQEIRPLASLNAPNNAYTEELAANGVMCLGCQVSQPIESYQELRPYSWGTLMSSTQGYVHRAEYVAKRLAGRPAELAGDPTLQLQDRVLGLVYYNNGGEYEQGVDFFEEELATHGVGLSARRDYQGYPDTVASQQAAQPIIQAMLDAGVTTILCACDPFAPIFFTQAATRQAYFPEWVLTGSALTDTTLFGRLYDQQQWANAFGISFLTARVPEELSDSLRLLRWHFGQDYEPASSQYAVIRAPLNLFFLGVHLAGPSLTPGTFERALFEMPPIGRGHVTQGTVSYGRQIWSLDDYTGLDDITMLWWDRTAQGQDEVGNPGVGMYRYVDGGKRYLPGEQPDAPPKAFQQENSVTVYGGYPEGDRPPEYPHE